MLSQASKHLDKSIPDKSENKICSRSRKKAKVLNHASKGQAEGHKCKTRPRKGRAR